MEIKSKEQIAKMNIDEKRAYLAELEQYREQLMATKSLREQGSGLKRAAETMMKYNPTGAFDLMDKSAQTEIDRKRVEQLGMNKSRVVQLEQLWKDATRSLRQARIDRDQPSIKKYEGQIKALEEQLATLAPDTWGNNKKQFDDDVDGNVSKAVAEGNLLVDSAKDIDKDGKIDDVAKLDKDIAALVTKYNISEADIQEVKTYLQAKKDEIEGIQSGKLEKSEEGRRIANENRARVNDWRSKNKNIIDRLETVAMLGSSFGNLTDKTNQLNVKKIRLRMASNESVNDSDIINATDFNTLQQVARKFNIPISALTEEGAKQDVNAIKAIYIDLERMLKAAAGDDAVFTKEVNNMLNKYKVPSFSTAKDTTGGLKLNKPSKLPAGVTYEVVK